MISDLLAQWLIIDWSKCASFLSCVSWTSVRNQLLIGIFLRGWPVHYWYLFLQWLFRKYDGSPQPHEHADADVPDKEGAGGYSRVSVNTPTPPPSISSGGAIPPGKGSAVEVETFKRQEPMWVVLCKVALDQLTYGPFSNWYYFYVIGWLEGRSMASCHAAVARDFWPLMVANWKVWPLVTLINFKFVPLNLQVLFGGVVRNERRTVLHVTALPLCRCSPLPSLSSASLLRSPSSGRLMSLWSLASDHEPSPLSSSSWLTTDRARKSSQDSDTRIASRPTLNQSCLINTTRNALRSLAPSAAACVIATITTSSCSLCHG